MRPEPRSSGCSPPRLPAPSWVASIPIRSLPVQPPNTHNHCAAELGLIFQACRAELLGFGQVWRATALSKAPAERDQEFAPPALLTAPGPEPGEIASGAQLPPAGGLVARGLDCTQERCLGLRGPALAEQEEAAEAMQFGLDHALAGLVRKRCRLVEGGPRLHGPILGGEGLGQEGQVAGVLEAG